jgi:5-methylcytosine-specific restriction enzyme B
VTIDGLPATPSEDAIRILRLLKRHHNVLIVGPSRTGKSRLLDEVRHWFRQSAHPGFSATGPNAFPEGQDIEGMEEWLPSPERTERKVFSITFHQGTKRRDFIDGVSPHVSKHGAGFRVTYGPLYLAAQHAKTVDGAALVEVDEVNRGPAVAIFADLIKAMETDKRLLPDGSQGPNSASFYALDEDGKPSEHYLPHHVYILAAMNEADTSVEPLDVAFLSRFQPFRLAPRIEVLREQFHLPVDDQSLPAEPMSASDVLGAAVRAWHRVNRAIEMARGAEFQIGHGIFLTDVAEGQIDDLDEALRFAAEVWNRLYAHLKEVFFGDTRSLAEALNAGRANNPFQIHEELFADNIVMRLAGPTLVDRSNVYQVLSAVAAVDQSW